jgi:hypothetical protein
LTYLPPRVPGPTYHSEPNRPSLPPQTILQTSHLPILLDNAPLLQQN